MKLKMIGKTQDKVKELREKGLKYIEIDMDGHTFIIHEDEENGFDPVKVIEGLLQQEGKIVNANCQLATIDVEEVEGKSRPTYNIYTYYYTQFLRKKNIRTLEKWLNGKVHIEHSHLTTLLVKKELGDTLAIEGIGNVHVGNNLILRAYSDMGKYYHRDFEIPNDSIVSTKREEIVEYLKENGFEEKNGQLYTNRNKEFT